MQNNTKLFYEKIDGMFSVNFFFYVSYMQMVKNYFFKLKFHNINIKIYDGIKSV